MKDDKCLKNSKAPLVFLSIEKEHFYDINWMYADLGQLRRAIHKTR